MTPVDHHDVAIAMEAYAKLVADAACFLPVKEHWPVTWLRRTCKFVSDVCIHTGYAIRKWSVTPLRRVSREEYDAYVVEMSAGMKQHILDHLRYQKKKQKETE